MIKWGLNNLGFIVVKNRFLVSPYLKRALGLAVILLFTLLPLLNVEAAPNYQINYQGKLHDSAGDPVTNGDYDIVFNLYTASSGGSPIWTESHTGANDVTTADGLFSVMLGSITSIASVNFNQTLYLGVTVEADSEMTPRKVLGTVPSAFEADKLDGLTSADFISTSTTALPNVWSASGLGSVGSSTATTTFLGNLAAAGSSIFSGILTVFDRVTSPYFVATSTSVASVFPYASTTMITSTTASTTNLIISGLGSGLTKVTNGVVSLATAGTDYLTSAFQNWQISGGYLTPTTTQVVRVGGLVSTASSTISGAFTVTGAGNFNTQLYTGGASGGNFVGKLNIGDSSNDNGWVFDTDGPGANSIYISRVHSSGSQVILRATTDGINFPVDRIGLGTTTPGTLFSLGDTGASTINITPTGTSTFGLGINLRAGCFAVNGNCIGSGTSLSGGTAGMLAAWTSSSALTATSSPTALSFTATSTSQASVFPYASTTALTVSGAGNSFIVSQGNVGIGTTTPQAILSSEVSSNAFGLLLTQSGATKRRKIGFGLDTDVTQWQLGTDFNNDSGDNFWLWARGGGFIQTWLDNGNVGIGTTSPYARLSVAGETVAQNFTATSTSLASTFPYASTTALTVSGQAHITGLVIPDVAGSGIVLRDAGSASLAPAQNQITWAHPSSSEDTNIGYLDASNFVINVRSGGTRQLNFTNSAAGGLNVLVSEGLLAVGTTTVGAGISASSTTQVGLMVDQRGTDDILRLLDAGTNVFTVQDGGNVGIGTSSPQAKLAIGAGNILLDNNQYLSAYKNAGAVVNILGINTSSQTVLTSGSGNNIIFNPSGSTAMTLSSGGLLGIGTTSPDYLLTLGNTASAGNNKIAIDAAANRQSSIAFRSAGVNKWHLGRGDSDVLSDSTFFIGTDSANANDPGGNGARFVINSTGLIGMGTVAPDENLHISGNSTTEDTVLVLGNQAFTGGMLTTLKWQADTDGASERDTAAIKAEQTGATTGKLRFFTDNGGTKEGAVLTDLGFWGVGTTTPGAQLSASSSASNIGLMIDQRGTADIARFLDAGTPVFKVADGGEVTLGPGTSNPGIQLQEAGTMRWTIYNDNTNDRFYITDDDTDNGVYIAQDATSWTANSDIRLKENIVPIEGALEKLLNLTGYTYNFKGTKRNEIGLIAQEVLPLFPELVDTNGTYLGLTYDRLGPIIIQAIKEQQLQIEEISDLTSTSTTMWSLDEETGNLTPFGLLNLNNQDLLNVKSITSASGNWSIGEDGTLTAKKIQTEELCVGNVCIDQDDLRDILRSADINFLDHINNDDDNSTTTDDTATSTDDTATTTDETVSSTPLEEPTGDETPTDDGGATPEPEIEEPVVEETPPAEIPTDNGGTEPEPEATPDPVPAE
ncbi:MAG: tail fiber domain-containing protein [Candidatus Pacebacteria bacterium]|nr:tail fiber domain-containing protein [Candidatus Paceibacterota bacterium]